MNYGTLERKLLGRGIRIVMVRTEGVRRYAVWSEYGGLRSAEIARTTKDVLNLVERRYGVTAAQLEADRPAVEGSFSEYQAAVADDEAGSGGGSGPDGEEAEDSSAVG